MQANVWGILILCRGFVGQETGTPTTYIPDCRHSGSQTYSVKLLCWRTQCYLSLLWQFRWPQVVHFTFTGELRQSPYWMCCGHHKRTAKDGIYKGQLFKCKGHILKCLIYSSIPPSSCFVLNKVTLRLWWNTFTVLISILNSTPVMILSPIVFDQFWYYFSCEFPLRKWHDLTLRVHLLYKDVQNRNIDQLALKSTNKATNKVLKDVSSQWRWHSDLKDLHAKLSQV